MGSPSNGTRLGFGTRKIDLFAVPELTVEWTGLFGSSSLVVALDGNSGEDDGHPVFPNERFGMVPEFPSPSHSLDAST